MTLAAAPRSIPPTSSEWPGSLVVLPNPPRCRLPPLSNGEHPAAQRERDQPGRSSRTCPCHAWWATSPEFSCGSVRRLRLLGRARSTLIPCELCINFTAHIFAWVCASAWLWFCIMLHGFQVNFAYAFYSIMLDLHIYQYAAVFGITSRASAFVVRYALQSKSQK